jgi:hypothetical protein
MGYKTTRRQMNAKRRQMNLPDDWRPSREDMTYGLALGLKPPQVNDIAEDMRLWAGANANRAVAHKANWSMAFKGWMRREVKNGRHGPAKLGRGSVLDAFDELEQRLAGRDDRALGADDLFRLPPR